jgi:hypothetical protein
MRTVIDIPEPLIKSLDGIAGIKKISRAELVRQMLEHDLIRQRNELLAMAVGGWKDKPIDGLAHQRKMRDEEWE